MTRDACEQVINYYVAMREKDGISFYVAKDNSQFIHETTSIFDAEMFNSPSTIMQKLGGHYKGYVPLRIQKTSRISSLSTGIYPDPIKVFYTLDEMLDITPQRNKE